MVLKWGDIYKGTDALGFTVSKDVSCGPKDLAPFPSPSYDIREELFEIDEETSFEIVGNDFQASSVYSTDAPSRRISPSTLNLSAFGEDGDDEIYFPSYDDDEYSDKVECMEPAAEIAPVAKWPVSLDPIERPEDDTAVREQPSRHVDYLSHDWSEEDVWASWKHIVSKRDSYNNSARLENASWRSWAKKRSNLRTVPPETVKWMKDHDLTWLYGPLAHGPSHFGDSFPSSSKGHRMSRAKIACHSRKPILKKRSPSEIMLRHSVWSSLLLKQAVVAKSRKDTTPTPFPFELSALTRSTTTVLSSEFTTGVKTPGGWKKVQFHEVVEECIAIANAGDEDHEYQYCSDSDSDVIVMRKQTKLATSKWLPSMKPKKQASVSKTIEKLGHAPLKDAEPLEDVPEEESNEEISNEEYAALSSQVTTSASASMGHDSDEEDDMDRQPPAWLQGRKDSVRIVKDRLSDFKLQQDEVAKEAHSHRPHLERRDETKENEEVPHVPAGPKKQGSSDSSIKFELPPIHFQLSNYSFSTPRYQSPQDDYFLVDPGMTDGESSNSEDMARSSSQSSTSSDKSKSPGVSLDNCQRTLVQRVMDEFWTLFNQQWDTCLSPSSVSWSLSPSAPTIPLSFWTRCRDSEKELSLSRQASGADNSNYFETTPEDVPASPDKKAAVDYETYLHRELPRHVHQNIKEAVRGDTQINEAHLIGNLVNIIHDCEDKIHESYFETSDRKDTMEGLAIQSLDPFQSSAVPEDTTYYSEIPDAAFHRPSSEFISEDRSLFGSSTASTVPSTVPPTPGEMIFSDFAYTSEIASSMTSPAHGRRDLNKYSLPQYFRVEDVENIREADLYSYEELDEAFAWSQVF